jgi:hypothetical protein
MKGEAEMSNNTFFEVLRVCLTIVIVVWIAVIVSMGMFLITKTALNAVGIL